MGYMALICLSLPLPLPPLPLERAVPWVFLDGNFFLCCLAFGPHPLVVWGWLGVGGWVVHLAAHVRRRTPGLRTLVVVAIIF